MIFTKLDKFSKYVSQNFAKPKNKIKYFQINIVIFEYIHIPIKLFGASQILNSNFYFVKQMFFAYKKEKKRTPTST